MKRSPNLVVSGCRGLVAAATLIACGSDDGTRTAAPTDAGADGAEVDVEDLDADASSYDTRNDGDGDARDAADASETSETPDGATDVADVALQELGGSCSEDSDCATLDCEENLQGSGVGVCTQPCFESADCPNDFDCALVRGSETDAVRICLPETLCIDADNDGFGIGPDCLGLDCEPDDPNTWPGADEVCDLDDNDCDSQIDENVAFAGADCDTGLLGACALGRTECSAGITECVPRSRATAETCDGVDNDCDGFVDNQAGDAPLVRACFDGAAGSRGVGTCMAGEQTCHESAWTACLGQVLPAAETCDGLDNDCDGEADNGLLRRQYWPDADDDGFGSANAEPVTSCAQPAGHVANNNDCDDARDDVWPGAAEFPGDRVDGNCDGAELCYRDSDNDGYRADADAVVASLDLDCDDSGEATDSTPIGDCDDFVAARNPGATEIAANGVDEDCNLLEICYIDADDDGVRPLRNPTVESNSLSCALAGLARGDEPSGDCDDNSATVFPGAAERVADGIDQDCDGEELCYRDGDDDDFGAGPSAFITSTDLDCSDPFEVDNVIFVDCNDANESISPDALEVVADGIDQDCDGRELCYLDNDNDGAPHPSQTIVSADLVCTGFREVATAGDADCNDSDGAVYPGAAEIVADGIDQDCTGGDRCFADADNDGYRTTTSVVSADLDCIDAFEGIAADPLDCDDSRAGVNAGATEVCGDGFDNNCDGDDDGCSLRGAFSLVDADLVFYGEDEADVSGTQVFSAGDVNCDGIDDLVIGAPGDETAGANAGAVYVLYGPLNGGQVDLASADVKFTGARAEHLLGTAIDAGADFNGDGCDDIAVGAPGFDTDNFTPEPLIGAVYLIWGTPTEYSGVRSIAAAGTFRYRGQNVGDSFGQSVAFVSSYAGSTNADLVVGAPFFDNGLSADAGAAYVILGDAPAGDRAAAVNAAAEIWIGDAAGDGLGRWVTAIGRFDGDAHADIAIGAFTRNINGTPAGAEAGSVYIAYGGAARGVGLSPATATAVARFDATDGEDRFGAMLDGEFDFNGDGFDDLLVKSARSDFNGRIDSGSAWMLYGRSSRFSGEQTITTTYGPRFDGTLAGDRFGSTVQAIGDVDGDGFDEIAIGSIWSDVGATNAGATYVWYGHASLAGVVAATSRDGFFAGVAANDNATQCGAAGDINDDGFVDLAIGVPGDDTGGPDSGASYIVFGGPGY